MFWCWSAFYEVLNDFLIWKKELIILFWIYVTLELNSIVGFFFTWDSLSESSRGVRTRGSLSQWTKLTTKFHLKHATITVVVSSEKLATSYGHHSRQTPSRSQREMRAGDNNSPAIFRCDNHLLPLDKVTFCSELRSSFRKQKGQRFHTALKLFQKRHFRDIFKTSLGLFLGHRVILLAG